MSKERKSRRRISFVICLLISLFLSVLLASVVLVSTIFNSKYMLYQADRSQYAIYLRDDIQEDLSSGVMSGFDESFYETAITEGMVSEDLNQEIMRIYNPQTPAFDFDTFKSRLYNMFLSELIEIEGENISDESKEALLYLADVSTTIYRDNIQLWLSNAIVPLLSKGKSICVTAIVVSSALLAFSVFTLLRINRSKRDRLRHMIYSLSASFVTLAVPTLIIILSGKLKTIGISNKGLYNTIVNYTNGTLYIILLCCAILIAGVAIMAQMFHNSGHKISRWD